MKHLRITAGLGALLALAACGSGSQTATLTKSGLNPEKFKAEFKGDSTALYTLVNANGAEACITNFGGRLVSMMVPDKNGNLQDVVLGFDSIQAYFPENNLSDFGASIGRYANRINQGKIVIDGDTIQLPKNNFGHCLHGGGEMGDLGWQYRVYSAEQPNDSTLKLTIVSPDGDNQFPGNLTATVTYTLTNDNALDIKYSATTDKPTVVNLTNHSYFNLSGNPSHPVTDNLLRVVASGYTPVDSTYMTTGEIATVEGTPFDFRTARPVGENIKDFANEQIKNGNGYDHNFVLDNGSDVNNLAAELYSPESGIVLEVFTNEPGIQIYSGNFLDGTVTGKKGIVYNQHAGICLETQHYPDSPNKPQWPSVRLNPGETYNSECIYKFSVKE
ncbi:MAG: galactose mutarotase [Muribaculaceae bacterium]|nr:galactose mutarotase [Muribaculaceae bacterium]